MNSVLLLGVFLALLSVVAGDRGPVDWYDCKGKPDANYVHPYDCTKFMTCVAQFYAYERDCVVGLHYDPANDRCEWPEIVGCITDPPTTTAAPTTTTPSTTTSATTTTQTTTIPTTTTPTTTPSSTTTTESSTTTRNPICNDRPDGNYPHPTNCSKFISCVAGEYVYEMDCPAGLHYDPRTDQCDYPEVAGCDPRFTTTTENPTTTTTEEPTTTTSPTTTIPTTTTEEPSTTTQNPIGNICNGRPDGNYPHPTNCSKFISCVAGEYVYEMDCPAGLHYDPKTDQCDYPEVAGCDPRFTTTTEATTPEVTTLPPDTTTQTEQTTTQTEQTTTSPPETTTQTEQTTTQTEQTTTSTPETTTQTDQTSTSEETTTQTEQTTTQTEQTTTSTPETTTQTDQTSTSEETTTQTDQTTTSPPETTTQTEQTTTSEATTTNQTESSSTTELTTELTTTEPISTTTSPPENSTDPTPTTTTPDPDACDHDCEYVGIDCHNYYSCINFTRKEYHECNYEHGLAFNPSLKTCDRIENVEGCRPNSTEPTTTPPPEEGCICEYRPHESDCSKYYFCPDSCRNSSCQIRACPGDLLWSVDFYGDGSAHQQCSLPENANCVAEGGGGSRLEFSCFRRADGLYKNEKDCRSYWKCQGGGALLYDCPKGYVYNADVESCDLEARSLRFCANN